MSILVRVPLKLIHVPPNLPGAWINFDCPLIEVGRRACRFLYHLCLNFGYWPRYSCIFLLQLYETHVQADAVLVHTYSTHNFLCPPCFWIQLLMTSTLFIHSYLLPSSLLMHASALKCPRWRRALLTAQSRAPYSRVPAPNEMNCIRSVHTALDAFEEGICMHLHVWCDLLCPNLFFRLQLNGIHYLL